MRLGVAAVTLAVIAAACGGSSGKKKTAANQESTTTTTVTGDTTTTVAGGTGDATTTTAATVAGQTTTTAKAGSTTATKKTTVTTTFKPTPNTQPALLNVVATTTTAPGGPTPVPGGSLQWAVSADSNGLDPVVATSASSATDGPRDGAVFDVLFFQDSTTYDLVAQLAQGMTSTDGKVWDMKLRPNVKFSDGTTLDADAVKYNYQRIQDASNASPVRSSALAMTDMTVVDPLTLRITLAAVNGQFPRVIANQLPFIGSPAAIQKQGKDDFNVHPVGAGPFLIKEYVKNDHTLLIRNPTYWAAPLPYLDSINIRVIPDDSQRYNSLIAGEIQGGRVSRPQDVAAAKAAGKSAAVAILNGGNDLIFNDSKAPFDNKQFRKAISEAIDLDAYNTSVESGAGIPARTLFQNTSPLFEDIKLSVYNPTDASAIFKSIFDANGGKKTEFTINASVGKSVTAAEFMQAQLLQNDSAHHFKDYVTANVATVTTPVLVSGAVSGNFQAQIWANLPLDPEPNLYSSFHCNLSTNFNRYCNADVDKALETGRNSLDAAARHAAYKTLQQIFADEQPSFFYARTQQGYLFDPKIHDLRLYEDGTALWDKMWMAKS